MTSDFYVHLMLLIIYFFVDASLDEGVVKIQ